MKKFKKGLSTRGSGCPPSFASTATATPLRLRGGETFGIAVQMGQGERGTQNSMNDIFSRRHAGWHRLDTMLGST